MKDSRAHGAFLTGILALSVLVLFPLYSQDNAPGNEPSDDLFTDVPSWRQALGGAVIGRPAAQAESVVAVTDGGNLKSYSSQGRLLWDYYARGRLTPHTSRSREGTSYICRTNGLLIAVNRTGRELWRINLGSPITSPVLTGWDGRLFVVTGKKITCMTAAGYTLWSNELEKEPVLAPVLDAEGGLIVVQEQGLVQRFDPFGGVFSSPDRALPGPEPAAAVSLKIKGWGHSILLLFRDSAPELVYPGPGYGESLRGILELPGTPVAAAGRNGEAAVLFEDGKVALLSLEQRKILWTESSHISGREIAGNSAAQVPGEGSSAWLDFFYDERGVYLLTKSGGSGFAPDGSKLWTIRLKGAAAVPVFGDDGILYSGGADWILYAYRLETQIKAQQHLLYGPAPEGSYGTGNPGPSSWADFPFRFGGEMEERLREIRRAVEDGNIGVLEKEYAAWLMETAGSSANAPRSGNSPPVQAHHRREAAQLLAFLGSRETIPFLTEIFGRDPDFLVRAAAAEAIGRIGVDPEGRALAAFDNAVFPPAPLRDETVLVAVASATGALCRFSGPPLSSRGIRILTALSSADRPPVVRNRAQRELRSLR